MNQENAPPTGYRVALDAPSPFEVDVEKAASQRYAQMLLIHSIITAVSIGMWMPGLLFWLIFGRSRSRAFVERFGVRLRGARLEVGNDNDVRSVGLDAITDVRIKGGYLTVTARGTQPLSLYGMKDPRAAADAIFAARDEFLRGLSSPQRALVEADAGPTARETNIARRG